MGGTNSGRRPDPVKQLIGLNQPSKTDDALVYLPNYSGVQAAALRTATPLVGGINDLTDVVITAAATGDIIRYNGTNWVDYPDSNYAASSHTHADYLSGAIVVVLSSSGAAILDQTYVDVLVPFNCTLKTATILPNTSGSITIDVRNDTYANFPPTVADSIVPGAMVLSANTKFQDTTITDWIEAVETGDILRIIASGAATTISQATVILEYTRP